MGETDCPLVREKESEAPRVPKPAEPPKPNPRLDGLAEFHREPTAPKRPPADWEDSCLAPEGTLRPDVCCRIELGCQE